MSLLCNQSAKGVSHSWIQTEVGTNINAVTWGKLGAGGNREGKLGWPPRPPSLEPRLFLLHLTSPQPSSSWLPSLHYSLPGTCQADSHKTVSWLLKKVNFLLFRGLSCSFQLPSSCHQLHHLKKIFFEKGSHCLARPGLSLMLGSNKWRFSCICILSAKR